MDAEAFRKYGKEMVDFVADYWESLPARKPLPDVQPGYIWEKVPSEPPTDPEPWENIFADIDPVVLQGNTNWHHPHFFAYYPTACSYPAIMGDILSSGIASIGFSWKSSPSMTELEMAMTDWLAKAIGLPEEFLNAHAGPGAGMIQRLKQEDRFEWVQTAVSKAMKSFNISSNFLGNLRRTENGVVNGAAKANGATKFEAHDPAVFDKMAHSSVEKDAMLAGVRFRKLRSSRDEKYGNYSIPVDVLENAIKEDRSQGLVPFILVATIGTTNTCGVDSVKDLGPICKKENIWLHVDAAYAGSFLLCEEYRHIADGMEYVDSFNFNAHKALMINFDCSPMWFRDATEAIGYFNVDPVYLRHEHQNVASDYRHLQVALGRRFRSLKIWFVLRALGIRYIQNYLRKEGDYQTEKLCSAINSDGRIHLVIGCTHGTSFLRFAVVNANTTDDDVRFAYRVIVEVHERASAEEEQNNTT
ncbi:Protein BAS-1 b [Aphelenchoides avenae]|nr:Protein BAS-1 b [Aphelenchus avenae]